MASLGGDRDRVAGGGGFGLREDGEGWRRWLRGSLLGWRCVAGRRVVWLVWTPGSASGAGCVAEEALVVEGQVFDEEIGDEGSALGRGVDEVARDEAGMAGVPAGHGAVAAHGVKGIEERAVLLGGDAALDGDDAGDGVVGLDLVDAGALAAVHGAHDEDGDVGERGADAGDGGAEGGLVLLVDVGAEAGLVGAVVDDDERGAGVLERGGPGGVVEAVREDGGGGSVEAEGVVEDAAMAGAEGLAKETDGAGGGFEVDGFGAGGRATVCQAGCGASAAVEKVSTGVSLAETARSPPLGRRGKAISMEVWSGP